MGQVFIVRRNKEFPPTGLISASLGEIVQISENGTNVPFYVVDHRKDSVVLLLRQTVHSRRAFNSTGQNEYNAGAVDNWLTGTYLGTLSATIQNSLALIDIEYTAGQSTHHHSTLQRKIFLPSATELGLTGAVFGDGIKFDYVPSLATTYNSSAQGWYTRTPSPDSVNNVVSISTTGIMETASAAKATGIRPVIALNGSTPYNNSTKVVG